MPRKTSKNAEQAGAAYAKEQIDSDYFMDWCRDQLLEASKMPPSDVLPLEDKHDASIIAKNMLKQLEWDTKKGLGDREIKDLIGADVTPSSHDEFYVGFKKACDASRDLLADELLQIKGEMGGGGVGETRKVDPVSWYVDGYKGETRIRTLGPYSSKKEATTAARGKTGIEWGDPYQGMDMGHSGGVGEAHRPKARGSRRRA